MRVTRGHVLLLFGVLTGVVTLILVLAPGVVPAGAESLQSDLEKGISNQIGLLLSIFVLLVVIGQLLRSNSVRPDRTPIVERPPEVATEMQAPSVTEEPAHRYDRAREQFERPDRETRQVALYGRRAIHSPHVDTVDSSVRLHFETLADTAVEAYATAMGCDEETAERAVARGTWTDDRIVNAFLATETEHAPSFTTWERLTAWIGPHRTFEARTERTLGAIEQLATSYLTYSRPVQQDGTGKPVREISRQEPTTGERATREEQTHT